MKNFFSKHKNILLAVIAVVSLFCAIMGQHFADNAKTAFGWTFWDIATGAGIVGFLLVVAFYKKKDRT